MFWIGFDFVLFPKSAVIYDVGGGAWPTSEILAHEFRCLKIVIQDRPETYEGGVRVRRYSLSSLNTFQSYFVFERPENRGSLKY